MKKIGRYEVVEELGRGAMGVVYKASDPTIGRLVAVKVLALEGPPEPGVPGPHEIFMREARAAGRLSHPGIVTIHDALEDPESHCSVIVMEFIAGRTLEKILLSSPMLGVDRSLDIIRQVAEALDYAHRNRIIHRDLKPANIIVAEDGRIKITDFGIAKIAAREGAMRTVAIMGTPSYMSPEQITGADIDTRSDLFSMGILLYIMLVGEKPFAGDTAAVMFKIVYDDPVLPSKVNPKLHSGHDYLVLRCLAKDRARRYASAREFLDDLDDVRNGHPPRSEAKVPPSELHAGERTLLAQRPLVSATEAPQPAASPPLPRAAATQPVVPQPVVAPPGVGARPNRLGAGIAAGMLLVAIVGVGIWKFRGREKAPAAAAPAPVTQAPVSASPSPPQSTAEVTAQLPSAKPAPSNLQPRSEVAAGTASPPARPAESQPAAVSPSRRTTDAAKTPAAPEPAPKLAAVPTRVGRVVSLFWEHDLKEATLTLRSDEHVIYQRSLKGKKRGGFLGIKGGYAAAVSRPITIPAGASQLSVNVSSPDGSVDLSGKLPVAAPAGPAASLRVTLSRGKLTAGWEQKLGSTR